MVQLFHLRAPRDLRRARVSPPAQSRRTRRSAGVLSPRFAATDWGTKTRSATRWPAFSVSPHVAYRSTQLWLPRRRVSANHDVAPLTGLRAGQPPQLLPVVQHARRRTARARRPRPICTGLDVLRRAGAPHAPRRARQPDSPVEFGTNWLGVRRFEEYNSVDCERFPAFSNELRQRLLRGARAVPHRPYPRGSPRQLPFALRQLHLREPAAGVALRDTANAGGRWNRWLCVDNASRYQRGGLLPMAVFLTQSSPGQRTSPVKRLYWVARNVLGQYIPAPPPNVPAHPVKEADLGNLTLAQTMARHREDPNCASCHATFDFSGAGVRRLRAGRRAARPRSRRPHGSTDDRLSRWRPSDQMCLAFSRSARAK